MKRLAVIILTFMASVCLVYGQKTGYVNTQTILAQLPEYATAQQTLEKLSSQYQQYLEQEGAKIEDAYKKYQADRPRLSEAQKRDRENQIITMERNLQTRQKEYFGEEGVMAKKSEQLMAPIKNKVDAAVKKVAQSGGYSLIIDLSVVQGVVYYDQTQDLSLEVIRNL